MTQSDATTPDLAFALAIGAVEAGLADLPEVSSGPDWDSVRQRRIAAVDDLCERLSRDYGARIADGGTARVTLCGITSTSTMGVTGALRNWLTAARARL